MCPLCINYSCVRTMSKGYSTQCSIRTQCDIPWNVFSFFFFCFKFMLYNYIQSLTQSDVFFYRNCVIQRVWRWISNLRFDFLLSLNFSLLKRTKRTSISQVECCETFSDEMFAYWVTKTNYVTLNLTFAYIFFLNL